MQARSERFADWLYRYRVAIFGVWLVHTFAIHFFVLGYMSGDGLSYRVAPVIELLQHGDMGKWKYPLDWTLRGYMPFVELAHLPFLAVLGMRGLLVGFPLVVFPLCVGAVFLLGREVTGDKRAAVFAGLAYVAIPMINQQPFTGLVDFAVAGILAFWLYAVLRLRCDEPRRRTWIRLAIATFLLSNARQQGLYLATALFPILVYTMFATRERFRIRVANKRTIVCGLAALAIGALPAIAFQIYRWRTYGSPIAPSELRIFGLKLADGVPLSTYLRDAGIEGDDLWTLVRAFFDGWVWHPDWPIGAFYHGQFMAAGLITIVALLLLPVFLRSSTRLERGLVLGCVLASLASKDFALPRWGYEVTIALALIIGRSTALLAASARGRPWFWAVCAVLIAHLLRPEIDLVQYSQQYWISRRMDVGATPFFLHGTAEIRPYPDGPYRLAIIERTGPNYVVQLYGRHLTNEVVGTVRATELGSRCSGLATLLATYPDVLFVDDQDYTKDCNRTCAIQRGVGCKAFRIAIY